MHTAAESRLLRSRPFFFTILMLSSIGLVTTDIYLPSLPFIETDLSTIKRLARLTLSLYLLSFSLSQLFYGPLSDKIGRRKVAILGLTLSLFGTILCIFSFNIASLILGRFLQGVGLGAGSTLARSIRRDVHSGNDLAHFGSYIIIGTSILFAVAPTLGGYIQNYMGWRFNFLFILIYTLFGLVCVWRWLPETNKELNPLATQLKFLVHRYLALLKSPIFIGYSLCSSLAFAGLTAYLTTSPFLFETLLGLTPIEYGRLGIIVAIGLGCGGYFNKLAIRRVGRHKMLVVGIVLIFFAGLLMLTLALFNFFSPFSIMIPMLIYSAGGGITFTNSFAGAFDPFARIAGFAAALFGCLQIFGGAIASTVVSLIHERTQIPLSIFILVIGISAYLFQEMAFHFSQKDL